MVLGPGTLEIGATGSEIDVSCLVNGCRISPTKNEGDATQKLCGTKVPGSITYTAKLSGNLDVDADAGAAGLFALSWAEPGTQQGFTFTPNTADGVMAAGTLVIDPLDFGADKYGDTLTSDFEFTIVGDVTYTYGAGGAAVSGVFRTGVPIQQQRIDPPLVGEPAPPAKGKKSAAA
jgi:hypothetical protein